MQVLKNRFHDKLRDKNVAYIYRSLTGRSVSTSNGSYQMPDNTDGSELEKTRHGAIRGNIETQRRVDQKFESAVRRYYCINGCVSCPGALEITTGEYM